MTGEKQEPAGSRRYKIRRGTQRAQRWGRQEKARPEDPDGPAKLKIVLVAGVRGGTAATGTSTAAAGTPAATAATTSIVAAARCGIGT